MIDLNQALLFWGLGPDDDDHDHDDGEDGGNDR
jgi:hypothetical protein